MYRSRGTIRSTTASVYIGLVPISPKTSAMDLTIDIIDGDRIMASIQERRLTGFSDAIE